MKPIDLAGIIVIVVCALIGIGILGNIKEITSSPLIALFLSNIGFLLLIAPTYVYIRAKNQEKQEASKKGNPK